MSERIEEIEARSKAARLPKGDVFPLDGKYYGTKVGFPKHGLIEVWFGSDEGQDDTPSHRELKRAETTGYIDIPGGHYEDAADLAKAEFFAHAPDDIRYLLATLSAANARAERAEALLDECHDYLTDGIVDENRAQSLAERITALTTRPPQKGET